MDLYLDNEMEKEAAFASRLSENEENWPQELQSDLFKQCPWLADYDVNINLDRVEPQRGYAFGYADISNKTERPEMEHEESGLPHIRIPLIIIERAVKPFSVFLDGDKVMPLTEDRLREALFNPSTFDISVIGPRDPSLVEPLMPPSRSGIGMGGETKMASIDKTAFQHISKQQWAALYQAPAIQALVKKFGTPAHNEVTNKVYELAAKEYGYHPRIPGAMGVEQQMKHQQRESEKMKKSMESMNKPKAKTSSVKIPLLKAIAPTLRESDVDGFVEKVASDTYLQAGFRRSGVTELLVDVFEKTKRASADDRLEALQDRILPTTLTFQKLPGGSFLVKSANVNAFDPSMAEGQMMDPSQASGAIGDENAQMMQPGQTATATAEPIEPEEDEELRSKTIEEFGEYKVQDVMGNQLMGWVFPKTLAWDGNFTPTPLAVFTNGSAYAMQDTIAGELVGKGANLPRETPRGDGVFYAIKDGEAVCTSPLTIHSVQAGPDGNGIFMGSDPIGHQVQVVMQEGIKQPMRISDVEYALPSDWKFMRLNNQTQLIPDPLQMNKTAMVKKAKSQITMFYNGSYNLVGGCGLEKIAEKFRYDLDPVSAEFMLSLLGVDGVMAKQKVAEARKKGQIKLAGLKTIHTISERYQEAVKTASAVMSKIPDLRRDLIKEAAAIEDESTVDKVLALNFINPENLQTFIEYLPELEICSEHIAEMLLFSYMGEEALPEGALDRAMKNMEEVILSLKAAQHAEV